MLVRPFKAIFDKTLLGEAEKEAYKASYPGVLFPIEFITERLHRIESGMCDAFTLVDEFPVGCIILSLDSFSGVPVGYIENIYIQPTYRSSDGLDQLLTEAKQHLLKHGIRIMRLDVTSHNHRAIAAYEKYGFTVTSHQMELCVAD